MRIWIMGGPYQGVLMIDCDNDHDAKILNEFTPTERPLVAVLKHGQGYLHPHLEIRKDKS